MNITEELRAWAREHRVLVGGLGLEAIADRIDEQGRKERADLNLLYAKLEEQADCLIEVGEALGVSPEQPDDEFFEQLAKAARDSILLPKDADGATIRVGERVQPIGSDPGIVSHMSLADDGWRVYVKYDGGNGTASGNPEYIRHYHAPTVEDVLREFAESVRDQNADFTALLVDEYAAKLRLAGEDA